MITRDDRRRSVCLELLRLRRKNAASLPSYLARHDSDDTARESRAEAAAPKISKSFLGLMVFGLGRAAHRRAGGSLRHGRDLSESRRAGPGDFRERRAAIFGGDGPGNFRGHGSRGGGSGCVSA
jgi:hypothetical protein